MGPYNSNHTVTLHRPSIINYVCYLLETCWCCRVGPAGWRCVSVDICEWKWTAGNSNVTRLKKIKCEEKHIRVDKVNSYKPNVSRRFKPKLYPYQSWFSPGGSCFFFARRAHTCSYEKAKKTDRNERKKFHVSTVTARDPDSNPKVFFQSFLLWDFVRDQTTNKRKTNMYAHNRRECHLKINGFIK